MSLPQYTRMMDDSFVNTWYEIRADVQDNIKVATPFWLALSEHGCLQTQVGGDYINKPVRYGTKSTQRFEKGSTLSHSEPALDTLASWTWRNFCVDIVRSLKDDQVNSGKYKIKSYLSARIETARRACVEDTETALFRWGEYFTTPKQMRGIYDIVAPHTAKTAVGEGAASDSTAVGTANGGINKATNSWWRNKDIAGVGPCHLNLETDLRTAWNTVGQNLETPNFILSSQDVYEYYEDLVANKLQIVRTAYNRKAADLGFDSQTYKGAPWIWSSLLPTIASDSLSELFLLNLNYIYFYYDPRFWFDMTNWKEAVNQFERVAYIVCICTGLITDQPRRHGYMYYTS